MAYARWVGTMPAYLLNSSLAAINAVWFYRLTRKKRGGQNYETMD